MKTKRLRFLPLFFVCCLSALAFADPSDHGGAPNPNSESGFQSTEEIWSHRYLLFLLEKRLKTKPDMARTFAALWNELQGTSSEREPDLFRQRLTALLATFRKADPRGFAVLARNPGAAGGFAKGLFPTATKALEKELVRRFLLRGLRSDSNSGRPHAQSIATAPTHSSAAERFSKQAPRPNPSSFNNEAPPESPGATSVVGRAANHLLKITRSLVGGTPYSVKNDIPHVAIPVLFDRKKLYIVEDPYSNQLNDKWNMIPAAMNILRAAGMDLRTAANPAEFAQRIQEKYAETNEPVSVVVIGHGKVGQVAMGKGSLSKATPHLELAANQETESVMAPLKGKVKDVLLLACDVANGLNSPADKNVMVQMADTLNAPVEGFDSTIFVNDRTQSGSTGFWSTYPNAHRVRVEPQMG